MEENKNQDKNQNENTNTNEQDKQNNDKPSYPKNFNMNEFIQTNESEQEKSETNFQSNPDSPDSNNKPAPSNPNPDFDVNSKDNPIESNNQKPQNPNYGEADVENERQRTENIQEKGNENKSNNQSPQTKAVFEKVNKETSSKLNSKNLLGPVLFFLFSMLCFGAGLLMHDLMFTSTGEYFGKSGAELKGVIPNSNIPEGTPRCGVVKNTDCIVYIQNTTPTQQKAKNFYYYAKVLGQSANPNTIPALIESTNKADSDYGEVWVNPGEFAEILIPR